MAPSSKGAAELTDNLLLQRSEEHCMTIDQEQFSYEDWRSRRAYAVLAIVSAQPSIARTYVIAGLLATSACL